ncbi:hypothetical protein [Budvicia diplopodorum]|uniref:hypothetical protein n=1 Tax=Budvicia diplopodorum TaxID=1119056 RepID=UPI00135B9FD7|nr:hypothetical protein [Budvicia diplopodorum]
MDTFGLARTHSGVLIIHSCQCAQYDHIEEYFKAALKQYSYLVKRGEEIDCDEWERRILEKKPAQSVDHLLNAIHAVMHNEPELKHQCSRYYTL